MALVTVSSPLRITGVVELVVQSTPEPRFVVDSKMYPEALADQVKTTLVPERAMASCGRDSVKLNTVPLPELPPDAAVPYRVFPDKIKSVCGLAPSPPPVKLYRFVKPEPSVLMANSVPLLEVPPAIVVPYSVLPDRVNPACGSEPSLPPVKLYRLVKNKPLVLTTNTVPLP